MPMMKADVIDADHQPDLLIDRRCADDVARLQILRRRAGVCGRDADQGAHAQGHRRVGVAGPAQRRRRSVQVRISVAIVMPETGFDDDPISPTIRDETVTKKNPKMMTRIDARTLP